MGNCLHSLASRDNSQLPVEPPMARVEGTGPEQAAVPPSQRTRGWRLLVTQLFPRRRSLTERLPREIYALGRDGSEEEAPECVICCEEFVPGDLNCRLPCQHIYHLGCIDAWLKRSPTCPCCRRRVSAAAPTPETH